jgi:hypothetical protein
MKSKSMRIAGSVLALVASVGGTIGGLVTVLLGAVGKAGSDLIQSGEAANQSVMVMTLGWLGILASFLALVLGIVVLCTRSQAAAWILLVCSILGIVLGGALVAFFMVLAVLGAIFALVGGRKVITVA